MEKDWNISNKNGHISMNPTSLTYPPDFPDFS